jgi:hypothetical protein
MNQALYAHMNNKRKRKKNQKKPKEMGVFNLQGSASTGCLLPVIVTYVWNIY